MKTNAETRLFLSLSDAQKRSFMRLLESVVMWQNHEYEQAGEGIVREVAKLPAALLEHVQPTLRQLYQSCRGDSSHRMTPQGALFALPDYEIAGFGNVNAARLFARLHGAGFFVSGRDLISASAAISTVRTYAFISKTSRALDDFSATKPNASWSYEHESIGDDESEIVVVEPRFRLFAKREVDAGRSSNARAADR